MEELAAAVLLGVIFGSAYALLALGIVLVYKGSRVFNFAQAEFGTVAGFMLLIALDTIGLPYVVSMVVALLGAVGLGLLVERLVVQPLADAPKVTVLVATAAVALGAISIQLFIGDASVRFVEPLINGSAFIAFGTAVSWQQLLWVLSLVVFGGGLFAFFRTDWGLAVLAASQEPTATDLVGVSTRKISMLVWGVAALLGGVAGVVVAPGNADFTPGFMTGQFLIFGFVAAVVGGMTSLPGAVVGGLVLGIVQQLAVTYLTDLGPGMGEVAIFALLVGVLAFRPTGLLGKEA